MIQEARFDSETVHVERRWLMDLCEARDGTQTMRLLRCSGVPDILRLRVGIPTGWVIAPTSPTFLVWLATHAESLKRKSRHGSLICVHRSPICCC